MHRTRRSDRRIIRRGSDRVRIAWLRSQRTRSRYSPRLGGPGRTRARPGTVGRAAREFGYDPRRKARTHGLWCEHPRLLVCVETVCAETEEEAVRLAGPMDVVKAGLLKGHSEVPFPSPTEAATHPFTTEERHALAAFRSYQARGTAETVVRCLAELADATGADELMPVTPIYALAARLRSYELVKEHVATPSKAPQR